MNAARVVRGAPEYPPALVRYLGDRAPAVLTALGDLDILRNRTLALFCSVRCPGRLIVQTYDLARVLRDGGVTVIGGFHSPMEKECLTVLLRGSQPVVVCPARGVEGMRLPPAWDGALREGRLLILSPFDERIRRPTTETARLRNELVAALADEVFIAFAEAEGKTVPFAETVIGWGKPVYTFEGEENRTLVHLGARAVGLEFFTMRCGGSDE